MVTAGHLISKGREEYISLCCEIKAYLESDHTNHAESLKLAFGQFCGHSFLDILPQPDFADDSTLDIYELDSLERFYERVGESLAYRAAAHVLRVIS